MKNDFTPQYRRLGVRPKTTLVSCWNVRNDSSNVNGILHPDQYLETPKEFIQNIDKLNRVSKGAYRKYCLATNDCYCREKPIRPKIVLEPDKLACSNENRQKVSRSAQVTPRQSFLEDDITEQTRLKDSEILKKYQETFRDEESSYTSLKKQTIGNVHGMEGEHKYMKIPGDDRNRQERSILTLLGTRDYDSAYPSSNYVTSGELDIGNIRKDSNISESSKFDNEEGVDYADVEVQDRNEMESNVKFEQVDQHFCVHQYQLDHMSLPFPVNVDQYGRSRCTICNKPMEGDQLQLSKPYFTNVPTDMNHRWFSKCKELKTVRIGGNKSKIELKLDENGVGNFLGGLKKPQYTNTFALRQQKLRR